MRLNISSDFCPVFTVSQKITFWHVTGVNNNEVSWWHRCLKFIPWRKAGLHRCPEWEQLWPCIRTVPVKTAHVRHCFILHRNSPKFFKNVATRVLNNKHELSKRRRWTCKCRLASQNQSNCYLEDFLITKSWRRHDSSTSSTNAYTS